MSVSTSGPSAIGPLPLAEEPPIDIGDAIRPAVAAAPRVGLPWLVGGGATALGLLTFIVLASHRTPSAASAAELGGVSTTPTTTVAAVAPPPSTTPDFSALEAAARGQTPVLTPIATQPVLVAPTPAYIPSPALAGAPTIGVAPAPPPQPSAAEAALAQRQKAPALVVDLAEGQAGAQAGAGPAGAAVAGAAGAVGARTGQERQPALNGDEQFAARVSAAPEPERVRASMLRNQAATVAQGTMIPGVLETALNSDLPGFARAVVSRDVRSFDGSTVLIPRGSRVIGEYRSGVALGASRAFVIWSRVIRPDGGSVQIGSSGTDQLGRAGLEGEVNRHFFQRFGGAVLLSVLNAGITSLTRSPSTSIVIGSSQEASSLASSALLPTSISPTIKVAQGAPIRIFVARDLDFSSIQDLAR